jgi:hypothetical protein
MLRKISLIVLCVFVLLVIPIIISFLTSTGSPDFIEILFKLQTNNDWIGFWGSYIGGVIGGLFTLIGVWLALKLENIKKERETIPNKVLELNTLKDLIIDFTYHEFIVKYEKASKVSDDTIGKLEFINEYLEKQLSHEGKILSVSVSINAEVFAYTNMYLTELRLLTMVIKKELLKLKHNGKLNEKLQPDALFTIVQKYSDSLNEFFIIEVSNYSKKLNTSFPNWKSKVKKPTELTDLYKNIEEELRNDFPEEEFEIFKRINKIHKD